MNVFIESILRKGNTSVLNDVHLFFIYLWKEVVDYYDVCQSKHYHMGKFS